VDYANLPSNFGTRAFNEYGAYPRTWNLEHGLELQHEVIPQLSATFSWFHGSFHNLTTTINRSLTYSNYTKFTVYNPFTGEAIDAYGLNADARGFAVDNLDTFDPDRERIYNAYNFEFRARPGRGAQIFGGLAVERQLDVNCTAPDNPNSLRFCNDKENDIPFNKNLRLAGSYPLPYGVTFSASLQSNASPNSSRSMVFTRGGTRYPASCPAPCPAGQIIGPTSVMGQSSLTIALEPAGATRVERITQFDFKLAKTFRVNRVSVSPTFEMFNVNNSDAIISYITTNSLSSSFLHPNSIMQPRMIGIGAQVRW
jgi:hypothetical protein